MSNKESQSLFFVSVTLSLEQQMGNDDILRSIGDILAAIDLKLEELLKKRDSAQDESIGEMKSFFEQLARIVSTQFIGDLPHAIELLEKKIDQFDHDLKDGLKSFSDSLIKYESKLEERIKKEIQALQNQFIHRLDHHQREQTEKLEEISIAVKNLGTAIIKLRNSINDFDSERLNPALDRLDKILSEHSIDRKSKSGFFRRDKK